MFDNDNDNVNDYYKPILVESSFEKNYNYYERGGDKEKKLSVKQYLCKIMPYLSDLINDHKAVRNHFVLFCYDKNEKMKFKLYQKVRDHCHYSGKFTGTAHNICNLNYKVPQ